MPEGVPQIVVCPLMLPIADTPPADTVRLIAKALTLAALVVLFFATIVNHMLAFGVRPVAV